MYDKELKAAIEAAEGASKIVLEVYNRPFKVETKSDDSPVTEADRLSDSFIRRYLEGVNKKAAFLTEEGADDKRRLKKDFAWIIDPLDGTMDFVRHTDEFAINIALAYKGTPVVGVVALPVQKYLYYAVKGEGAYRKDPSGKISLIRVSNKTEKLTALKSRSFHNAQEEIALRKHADKIAYVATLGAAAKFCAIAEGQAEISYRLSGNTKEWDTAAGDLIVSEAGGVVLQTNLQPITYNKEDVYNRLGYVIANRADNILL